MTPSLAVRADVNMARSWEALCRDARGPTNRFGTLQCFSLGIRDPFFNGAICTGPTDDPDRVLAHAMSFLGRFGLPWLLWIRQGVDDALLAAARRAGLRESPGPPAMGLSPIPAPPPDTPGVDITLVTDEAGLRTHQDLLTSAFEMPADIARRLMTVGVLDDPGLGVVVARVDDVPVSTALVSIVGTTAGIYNVGTPVVHRRKGYGRAVTRAAIDEGVRRGCDHAILQASEAGRPVYESMEFEHLGRYIHLEGPPG